MGTRRIIWMQHTKQTHVLDNNVYGQCKEERFFLSALRFFEEKEGEIVFIRSCIQVEMYMY